ncbi:hypothetical protein OROMI_001279 [Orobanche minor]
MDNSYTSWNYNLGGEFQNNYYAANSSNFHNPTYHNFNYSRGYDSNYNNYYYPTQVLNTHDSDYNNYYIQSQIHNDNHLDIQQDISENDNPYLKNYEEYFSSQESSYMRLEEESEMYMQRMDDTTDRIVAQIKNIISMLSNTNQDLDKNGKFLNHEEHYLYSDEPNMIENICNVENKNIESGVENEIVKNICCVENKIIENNFQLEDFQTNSTVSISISNSLESSPILLDLTRNYTAETFSSKSKENELNFDKSVKEINMNSGMNMNNNKSICSTNFLIFNVEKPRNLFSEFLKYFLHYLY